MYTREDFMKEYKELQERVENNEITEDFFQETEAALRELVKKQSGVKYQVQALVREADEMCELYSMIQNYVNKLYCDMKRKKLREEGIDLSVQSNSVKYNSYISHQLSYGDGFKVELKPTMAR
jgi:SMC interacting uncharacterized protein involved in chromosome segregation